MELPQQKIDVINKEVEKIKVVKSLADKTGLPAALFVFAPLLIFVIAVAAGIGASFFTRLIGVLYPTLKSIQALESPSKNDDKQWLTYWSIYGLLVVLDECAGCILEHLPYYYFIKMCLLIWLLNPATQGATFVYDKAIQPLLKRYEN